MTFSGAIGSALRQYATFTGRASRAEYWWFYLFTVLVGLIAGAFDGLIGFGVANFLVSVALFLPSLAVFVRRLHDSNLSGWWLLLPVGAATLGVFALVIGAAAGFAVGMDSSVNDTVAGVAVVALVSGALLMLASVVIALVLLLRPSTPGPNRFGPGPLSDNSNGYGRVVPPGGHYADYQQCPTPWGAPGSGQPSVGPGYGASADGSTDG